MDLIESMGDQIDSKPSSGSSESNEEDENELLEGRAKELEILIDSNKYSYDAHLELVGIYEKLTDLNSMREAYDRFHKIYPLTPEIWLNWITLEINLASNETDKRNVLSLFEKAVDDYQSVKLWLEYVQFTIGFCPQDETRAIFEKGLSSVGLNVNDGVLLWDTLREFELINLELINEESDAEMWEKQFKRIVEIFRRQLSVPLLNINTTYKEFKQFKAKYSDKIDEKPIEYGYKKALKMLEIYKPFEEQLLSLKYNREDDLKSDETFKKIEIYKNYISHVKEPTLIINLYERAVLEAALNSNIWREYCLYVLNLNLDLAIKVSERSLRNCTWDEELWIIRLKILESRVENENVLLECFENGIQSIQPNPGANLWLNYLEYYNRNFKDLVKFKKIYEKIPPISTNSASFFQLFRFVARIFARNGDMKTSRKIWWNLIHNYGKNANYFLEFAELERQCGDAKNLRILFQTAINSCTDYPVYVAEEWLMYEREFGTLKDVLNCVEKCEKIKENAHKNQEVYDEENGSGRGGRKKRRNEEIHEVNPKKRAKFNEKTSNVQEKSKSYGEKRDVAKKTEKKVSNVNNDEDKNGSNLTKLNLNNENNKPEKFDPDLTVFLSNLPYNVDESHLKEFFPNATSIFKPPDRKGKSCCFAYCTFSTPEEVATALARDRERINDRPIFISEFRADRNQRQPGFKYSTLTEKNKLFVKGLPFISNQEAVENIFKPYGAVAVRLVTKKNGQSKGCAYVDFPDEKTAEAAMKATDGLQIGEFTITVAVSNPPTSFGKEEIKAPTRHARSNLEMKLIPRGVQLKQKRAEIEEKEKQEDKTEAPKKKTNDDFRKLFC